MPKVLNVLIATLAVVVGLFLSPVPAKLGFYAWTTTFDPTSIGLTPAHHVGTPWGYTFEEYYDGCDDRLGGQRALVTGANSGIGFAIAKILARCGAEVTLACRSEGKCVTAAEEIRKDVAERGRGDAGGGKKAAKVATMTVDTSSLSSVRDFSKKFASESDGRPLDMLFLNAGRGIVLGEAKDPKTLILSPDGIETFFATNHLGHHLMWRYLKPLVERAEAGRVVLTSSGASFDTFPHVVATSTEELHGTGRPQTDMKYYGQSKLAQIAWAKKVARDLGDDSSVYVNSAHPGAVDTQIWDKVNVWPIFEPLLNFFRGACWTPEEGALTLLYLGTETRRLRELDLRGGYFHPQTQEVVNDLSLDEGLQDRLWDFSNDLVAEFVDVEV